MLIGKLRLPPAHPWTIFCPPPPLQPRWLSWRHTHLKPQSGLTRSPPGPDLAFPGGGALLCHSQSKPGSHLREAEGGQLWLFSRVKTLYIIIFITNWGLYINSTPVFLRQAQTLREVVTQTRRYLFLPSCNTAILLSWKINVNPHLVLNCFQWPSNSCLSAEDKTTLKVTPCIFNSNYCYYWVTFYFANALVAVGGVLSHGYDVLNKNMVSGT